MPGAIARNRVLVAFVTLLVAVVAVAYTLHKPSVYDARATVAVVPPTQDQALGQVNGATPDQYLASQLVLLQSLEVASRAALLADGALHNGEFTSADFSGPHSSLTIASRASTDANASSIIDISFRAHSATAAAAGANAVVAAYQSAWAQSVQSAYSSMISAIDATIEQVNAELAAGGANNPLNGVLTVQRDDLVQRRTLAVVDGKAATAQTPASVAAYTPSSASNHKVAKTALIGAIIGFLVGSVWAYARDVRRRRFEALGGHVGGFHDAAPVKGWAAWDTAAEEAGATGWQPGRQVGPDGPPSSDDSPAHGGAAARENLPRRL